MNQTILMLLAIASIGYSSICKENIFLADVHYGTKLELTLDSVNWDIESIGGDYNYYSYDSNGHIVRNIRRTTNSIDTIQFKEMSKDSLIWNTPNGSIDNWIKYNKYGFKTSIDDGYGTVYQGVINLVSDTLTKIGTSKYENDSPVASRLSMYSKGDTIKVVEIEGVTNPDTFEISCIETNSDCRCYKSGIESIRFVRTIKSGVLSDTLWSGGIAKQSRHYTITNNENGQSEKLNKPNKQDGSRIINSQVYDLIGRFKKTWHNKR